MEVCAQTHPQIQPLLHRFIWDVDLPEATRWRMKDFWTWAKPELKSHDEILKALWKKYGAVLNEDTNEHEIPDENQKNFDKEYQLIKDKPLEAPFAKFRSPHDFEPRKKEAISLPLSGGHLELLDWFLERGSGAKMETTSNRKKRAARA